VRYPRTLQPVRQTLVNALGFDITWGMRSLHSRLLQSLNMWGTSPIHTHDRDANLSCTGYWIIYLNECANLSPLNLDFRCCGFVNFLRLRAFHSKDFMGYHFLYSGWETSLPIVYRFQELLITPFAFFAKDQSGNWSLLRKGSEPDLQVFRDDRSISQASVSGQLFLIKKEIHYGLEADPARDRGLDLRCSLPSCVW